MRDFIGRNGFVWFIGVVEDRHDPVQLGRYRVRCFGYHTDDKTKIATEDLPWAKLLNPTTSACTSGVGQSPTGIVEGTWVIGFFLDGEFADEPVILGTLNSISTDVFEATKGFYDPKGLYPVKLNHKDTNKLARGINTHEHYPDVTIEEPESPYNAQYPYNQVYQSESGHTKEYDDTPLAERIKERHRSGTFYEVHPDGTKTETIVKDRYTVVGTNDSIHVKGDVKVYIDQNATVSVAGNCDMTVGGDMTTTVGGDMQTTVCGDWRLDVGGNQRTTVYGNQQSDINVNVNTNVGGNVVEQIGGYWDNDTSSNIDIRGSRIDFNKASTSVSITPPTQPIKVTTPVVTGKKTVTTTVYTPAVGSVDDQIVHSYQTTPFVRSELEATLKSDEGLVTTVYADGSNKAIGYGHNIGPDEPEYSLEIGDSVSMGRINQLFTLDVDKAIAGARDLHPYFDYYPHAVQQILCNMAYQLGHMGLASFVDMNRAVVAGNWATASEEMLDSLWALQTPNRAERLAAKMAAVPTTSEYNSLVKED